MAAAAGCLGVTTAFPIWMGFALKIRPARRPLPAFRYPVVFVVRARAPNDPLSTRSQFHRYMVGTAATLDVRSLEVRLFREAVGIRF